MRLGDRRLFVVRLRVDRRSMFRRDCCCCCFVLSRASRRASQCCCTVVVASASLRVVCFDRPVFASYDDVRCRMSSLFDRRASVYTMFVRRWCTVMYDRCQAYRHPDPCRRNLTMIAAWLIAIVPFDQLALVIWFACCLDSLAAILILIDCNWLAWFAWTCGGGIAVAVDLNAGCKCRSWFELIELITLIQWLRWLALRRWLTTLSP